MIPLTTDVRLKRGVPKAVAGIILGTFLLHVAVQACIDFGWVGKHFRAEWMTFDAADPNPFDWFLSIFSHANYWHWFGNMLYLWIFGSVLEDRIGSLKFFLLFLVCGIAANGLEMGLYDLILYVLGIPISEYHMRSLGASGAISGIMGLTMFRFYKAKVLLFVQISAFWYRPSIPLWIFCAYSVLKDFIGIFSGDNVAHLAHIGGFFGGLALGRFLGLRKESHEEIQMESAMLYRGSKMYADGAQGFEKVLVMNPANALAHQEAGFCYWGLHNPLKSADGNLVKSRQHFTEALELYLKEGKQQEAVDLYERLMKLFTPKDFPEKIPLLLRAYQKDQGLGQAILTSDPREKRKIFEDNFRSQTHRGIYQAAHLTLQDLLSVMEPGQMEPDLLEMAGEVCTRVKDIGGAETFFEKLAVKGDERQTVRAFSVLARAWLRTPKQVQLSHMYKRAAERLPDLKAYDEWLQVGENLRS